MERHRNSTCEMTTQRPKWPGAAPHHSEPSRSWRWRRRHGLGLPVDLPVPEEALQPGELCVLKALSPTLVEQSNGYLIRRTLPPLQLDHVVARTPTVRRGLEAVSAFSTDCSRSMVLPRAAEWTELDLAEANYYGVGVYVAGSHDAEPLVAPAAFPLWPETAASWTVSEVLYDRTIRCH